MLSVRKNAKQKAIFKAILSVIFVYECIMICVHFFTTIPVPCGSEYRPFHMLTIDGIQRKTFTPTKVTGTKDLYASRIEVFPGTTIVSQTGFVKADRLWTFDEPVCDVTVCKDTVIIYNWGKGPQQVHTTMGGHELEFVVESEPAPVCNDRPELAEPENITQQMAVSISPDLHNISLSEGDGKADDAATINKCNEAQSSDDKADDATINTNNTNNTAQSSGDKADATTMNTNTNTKAQSGDDKADSAIIDTNDMNNNAQSSDDKADTATINTNNTNNKSQNSDDKDDATTINTNYNVHNSDDKTNADATISKIEVEHTVIVPCKVDDPSSTDYFTHAAKCIRSNKEDIIQGDNDGISWESEPFSNNSFSSVDYSVIDHVICNGLGGEETLLTDLITTKLTKKWHPMEDFIIPALSPHRKCNTKQSPVTDATEEEEEPDVDELRRRYNAYATMYVPHNAVNVTVQKQHSLTCSMKRRAMKFMHIKKKSRPTGKATKAGKQQKG